MALFTWRIQDQNPRHTYLTIFQSGGQAGTLVVETEKLDEVLALLGGEDKRLLDFVQAKTAGHGNGWIFRESDHGRGWRLHETTRAGAVPDVRQAIRDAELIVDAEWQEPEGEEV